LRLIKAAGLRAFPPRLPEQPIFYPVTNFEYAEQIARDWNSKDHRHQHVGDVTEFDVLVEALLPYDEQQVGGSIHREFWILAERLDTFNEAILGKIRVIAEYHDGKRVR
jgi:hypothetical protein